MDGVVLTDSELITSIIKLLKHTSRELIPRFLPLPQHLTHTRGDGVAGSYLVYNALVLARRDLLLERVVGDYGGLAWTRRLAHKAACVAHVGQDTRYFSHFRLHLE